MDELKYLDYYAANPDELPSDPDTIEALMARLAGEAPHAEQSEPSATDGAGEAEAGESPEADDPQGEAKQEEAGETDEGEQQEASVLSRDGKHAIPYSVLQTEREKRRAAEQAMKALEQRLASAEAGTQQQGEAKDAAANLDAMAEDFPAVKALLEHTRKLESKLSQVTQRIEQDDATRADQETARVRAAVDANPVLLHWEHNDPDRWQAAVEADQRLQNSPAHQGLTLEQRLERAVQIVDAFYGPDAGAPKPPPPPSARPAKPAAAQQPDKPFKPRTLSDIPGGAVPAADPLEEFATLSVEKLGAQMAGMSPDQINALLARLG